MRKQVNVAEESLMSDKSQMTEKSLMSENSQITEKSLLSEVFRDTIKKHRSTMLLLLVLIGLNLLIFFLYGLHMEPFYYVCFLIITLFLMIFLIDLIKGKRRAEERQIMISSIDSSWRSLPEPNSLAEKNYQQMIDKLGQELTRVNLKRREEREDMQDYYTTWVHQIKTPIAVMRMRLGSEDSEENAILSGELFRIEQYVDMVLHYIRLESESNDLVIREYPLDDLIREVLRKYAGQFIMRRLRLNFEPTGRVIVTDKKWFQCILEQLLSNAIKYTPRGSVTIGMDGNGRLVIADTGIGIAEEDLPRIFEKGYTGINGRQDKKSSGLGLYLAKKAADKLALPITVQSKIGEGSSFYLQVVK